MKLMENKQTAVEWLVEKLKSQGLLIGEPKNLVAVKQAKEIEKQQIIQTYHKSALNEATHIIAGTSHISAEQYYNKEYGGNNEQQ